MDIPDTCEIQGTTLISGPIMHKGQFVVPDGVSTIGATAFQDCTHITSVTIPDSVTRIGRYAFCGCKRMTSVSIPDSVTLIEEGAFCECQALTFAVVPHGCVVEQAAFPDTCEMVPIKEYRRRLAEEIVENRADDTVVVVGMHSPPAGGTPVDRRAGPAI